jgi:hypothetical protein
MTSLPPRSDGSEDRIDEWRGTDPEGMKWEVEVETDCFRADDPPVVAVWVGNDETGEPRMDALAPLNSKEARQMAAALLRAADNLDAWKARIEALDA